MMQIKPHALQASDRVAIVSLSSGLAGEPFIQQRLAVGIKRLEAIFKLEVVYMPHALKGLKYVSTHPKERAEDLMQAFKDSSIKAIISTLGGEDTIRLLPYIDFETITNNPKIFLGFSDTTANHFMMYKAGLVSYYGTSILTGFCENVEMHAYTKYYLEQTLFTPPQTLMLKASPQWTSHLLEWSLPENNDIKRTMIDDNKGYELLQGSGIVSGQLLGGCLTVVQMLIGTELWPALDEWENKILFLETAEDFPTPEAVRFFLRNLAVQGILQKINGLIIGKPQEEKYYEEYKQHYIDIITTECNLPDLPIIYNVNFGHTAPICVIPYGVTLEINTEDCSLTLLEPATTL